MDEGTAVRGVTACVRRPDRQWPGCSSGMDGAAPHTPPLLAVFGCLEAVDNPRLRTDNVTSGRIDGVS